MNIIFTTKFLIKKNKIPFYLHKGLFKNFDLHEYQSKIILRKYGLQVQRGDLAKDSNQAKEIAEDLVHKNAKELIIKAQVHAGGRGKGTLTSGLKGGVKICNSPEEIYNYAKQMIGYNLTTHQTPKEGLPVKSVLILDSVDIKKQFYVAFLLDRTHQSPVLIISNEGGVDIEEVAVKNPSAIKVYPIDINIGLTEETAKKAVSNLDVENDKQRNQAISQLKKLYEAFIKLDSTQIEINPWALDTKGELYLVDAKVNIDESAGFRQSELIKMKENSEASEDTDPNETLANKYGLNYIGLKGNIGCLVNGAGLAMATMDIIKLKNGEPANFLDVGGGASSEQVTQAFEILNNHPNVKTILVNIFGGIMRCDIIAQGIIAAVSKIGVKVPIVIRLTGTNADQGRNLLEDFARNNKGKVNFITGKDLDEAAELAVKSVNEMK
jgi:succinyl-CoA synthetase beta subunit